MCDEATNKLFFTFCICKKTWKKGREREHFMYHQAFMTRHVHENKEEYLCYMNKK